MFIINISIPNHNNSNPNNTNRNLNPNPNPKLSLTLAGLGLVPQTGSAHIWGSAKNQLISKLKMNCCHPSCSYE